jgi:hypothetical protein
MADYNARFAKPPPIARTYIGRCALVTIWRTRLPGKKSVCSLLSQALTLQYDKVIFILELSEPAKVAIGKYVTVFRLPRWPAAIRYNGVELAYRTFDKVRQVDHGAIGGNKHLGAVLAMIRDEQLRRGSQRRSGPRRRDQRETRVFKVG